MKAVSLIYTVLYHGTQLCLVYLVFDIAVIYIRIPDYSTYNTLLNFIVVPNKQSVSGCLTDPTTQPYGIDSLMLITRNCIIFHKRHNS